MRCYSSQCASVVVIFVLATSISADQLRTRFATTLHRKDRQVFGVEPVFSKAGILSVSICLSACLRVTVCQSLTYSRQNRTCNLYDTYICDPLRPYGLLSLVPFKGSDYYDLAESAQSNTAQRAVLFSSDCIEHGRCTDTCDKQVTPFTRPVTEFADVKNTTEGDVNGTETSSTNQHGEAESGSYTTRTLLQTINSRISDDTTIPITPLVGTTQQSQVTNNLETGENDDDDDDDDYHEQASSQSNEHVTRTTITPKVTTSPRKIVIERAAQPFEKAKASCHRKGGYLAKPTSIEEHQYIVELMKKNRVTRCWIGAMRTNDREAEYIDGTQVMPEVVFWAEGQPNNVGGTQACIEIFGPLDYKWNDFECSNPAPYACQFS